MLSVVRRKKNYILLNSLFTSHVQKKYTIQYITELFDHYYEYLIFNSISN